MIKEKMINYIIVFLLILPMSFLFPWFYHHMFNLFSISNMILEKIVSVATMVLFMNLLLPLAFRLKVKLIF